MAMLSPVVVGAADEWKTATDVCYTSKTDSYSANRLKLDVYYSPQQNARPVVVWFHGGGLEGGQKEIPASLKGKGYVVVGVNYRLLPQVAVSDIIDDAAEAVAWTMRNIGSYGGDSHKITVAGHSAGGYLTLMLCLDKKWLAAYGADADSVMLYAPFSGQAITHFNLRKQRGLDPLQPTIDEMAPLFWVRGDCPPLLLICGDRELELFGRYDENQYLARLMKLKGHEHTYLYEIGGHGHNAMIVPGFHILETHLAQMLGRRIDP